MKQRFIVLLPFAVSTVFHGFVVYFFWTVDLDFLRAAGMGARMGHQLVGAYIPAARRSGAAIRLGRDTLLACGVARTGRASGAADKGGEELFAALRKP